MSLSAAIALDKMSCCSGSQAPTGHSGDGFNSVSSVSSAIAELAIASGEAAGPRGLAGLLDGEG